MIDLMPNDQVNQNTVVDAVKMINTAFKQQKKLEDEIGEVKDEISKLGFKLEKLGASLNEVVALLRMIAEHTKP